jgi:hypothetical protein
MATRTPTGTSNPDTATPGRRFERSDSGRRQGTETKNATKTTEFFAYLAVLAGILIAGLLIEDEGGNDFFAADKVWLYATILTVGYMVSRGLAKSGSREPYWSGGTNDDRDR